MKSIGWRWVYRAMAALALISGVNLASADVVTVFAAASTRNAMEEIAEEFAAVTGHSAVLSFAGSSVLARQIQQGAPADVFLSANSVWMDYLEDQGLIVSASRRDIVSNRLVLIGHGDKIEPAEIGPDLDLAGLLGQGRLSMALVDAVPAGIYGKAALKNLGLWSGIAENVAQADNARAALAMVSIKAAPLGVVYDTDARADPRVSVLGYFPVQSHPAIVYPVAAVEGADQQRVDAFLGFLETPAALQAFERQGFALITE
ncbi:MAG: molybdate ABC transporter substrate-binding protein [Pseudomonadota bacterium]